MQKSMVSVVRIEDGKVAKAIRKSIDLIGGMGKVVRPGEKVLLKPNWSVVPEEPKVAVVTNPLVVRVIADVVKEIGASPIISDSAARGVDTDLVIEATGYNILKKDGYQVVNLDKEKVINLQCPKAKILKTMKTFELPTKVDKIINIPLLKTHDSAEATLGLKNMKGLLHKDHKSKLHRVGLYEGVVDVNAQFTPDLVVFDGTWAMEGLGPMYGLPLKLDLIISSRDVVAADAVAGYIMGFEPAELLITKFAYERGLGEMDLNKIVIKGDSLNAVKRPFKRVEDDERIIFDKVNIVHAKGTCTGCRVAIMSTLFDMKNKGILEKARNFNLITGDVALPYGIPEDRVVAVGICVPKDKRGKRWVKGCPPNNAYTIEAITGEQFKDTYSTE